MAAGRRDVEFPTVDGLTLRGWLYTASGDGKHPCIIMANGLAGLKEQFCPNFAQRFQALAMESCSLTITTGVQATVFHETKQTLSRPVYSSRIVYWGTSMCGGSVLLAAAFDRRIRAVVSQAPFVSGEQLSTNLEPMIPSLYSSRQQLKAGFNSHLGVYQGIAQCPTPKPTVAIMGVGGRANLDGRPFQGSAAEFLVKQAKWLGEPSSIYFCLNDQNIIKPFRADVTAAKDNLEQETAARAIDTQPGKVYNLDI
ncbi:hypothetical protein FCOIX_4191 [Fusarium coicis]|nr:hypothetical protein FCOIX_4191 [Fusarium coicis]